MFTVKCPNCGWDNQQTSASCQRCQFRLEQPQQVNGGPAWNDPANAAPQSPPYPQQQAYAPQQPQYAAPQYAPPYPQNPYGVGHAPYGHEQGMQAYRAGPMEQMRAGDGIWREGDQLAMHKHGVLPDCCVRCAEPTQGRRLRQTLYWHHPAVYLAVFSPLIYVILALVLRKSAVLEIGMCERHAAMRRTAAFAGAGLGVAGTAAFVASVAIDEPAVALLGLGLMLVAIVWASIGRRTVTPAKIDDHYVWLRGLPAGYLARLPTPQPAQRW